MSAGLREALKQCCIGVAASTFPTEVLGQEAQAAVEQGCESRRHFPSRFLAARLAPL